MSLSTKFFAGWDFDEVSGTACAEAAGTTAYDGTAAGTSIVSSYFTKARRFANTSSDYVTAPSQVWQDIGATTSAISYACLIKFNSIGNQIIMRGDGESGSAGLLVSINSAGKVETFQNVTGDYSFPGGYMVCTGATTLSTATWYLIVVTYDGTYTKIYINNSLDGTLDVLGASGVGSTNLQGFGWNHVLFGKNEQSNGALLDADLDYFYIFNDVLDSTDRSDIYNGGSFLAYPFSSSPAFLPRQQYFMRQAVNRASTY